MRAKIKNRTADRRTIEKRTLENREKQSTDWQRKSSGQHRRGQKTEV